MMTETEHADVRNLMQTLAAALSQTLDGAGFALLVFDLENPQMVNYVSNTQRDDMLAALKEFVARNEGRMHEAPVGHQ